MPLPTFPLDALAICRDCSNLAYAAILVAVSILLLCHLHHYPAKPLMTRLHVPFCPPDGYSLNRCLVKSCKVFFRFFSGGVHPSQNSAFLVTQWYSR